MVGEWTGRQTTDRRTPCHHRFLLFLQAFCLFVLIGLVVEIVWAVLWFLLKWYLILKNRYEGGHETTQGEEEEPADL